jgi:hypothetical protein
LSIDPFDRTVGTADDPTTDWACPAPVERQLRNGLSAAAEIARTVVMVALASVAILVLLPAAIAAQAASAI